MLVDFLAYHQLWESSYTRQRMLPMLSTIYLREMARNPVNTFLYGQYDFHSIHRIKIRYGHRLFVVKWQKAALVSSSVVNTLPVEECAKEQGDVIEVDEPVDLLDESSDLQIFLVDGCWFLLTDENMELVRSAFPDEVDKFYQKKQELEESKRRKNPILSSEGSGKNSELPNSKGVQLNITEFYRSTKVQVQTKLGEDTSKNADSGGRTSDEKRKTSSSNFSKSTRRRLLLE
ncbi:flap endonuclease GEN-like 1 [Carica papaya]|uniref:flap endonuclease GEN-like 1 n=1 Tax=Carica papaya TaxID=3649 RepID=UPI000B8CC7C8|nr:flap endonuclease GEN-like 1 [Carica papaya]